MTPRITAALLVSALIRRVEAAGGHAMVLAKGDSTAGAIILTIAERGVTTHLLERALQPDDRYAWVATGPDATVPVALSDYIARRRRSDPDLWLVELDGGDGEAIARELIC